MGEGTPQSSALTEGEFVPDSPTLSPIELKQELPKYLPALQVRLGPTPPAPGAPQCPPWQGQWPRAAARALVCSVTVFAVNITGQARPQASHTSMVVVQPLAGSTDVRIGPGAPGRIPTGGPMCGRQVARRGADFVVTSDMAWAEWTPVLRRPIAMQGLWASGAITHFLMENVSIEGRCREGLGRDQVSGTAS